MKTCPVCDTDYPDQHTNCPTDGAVLIVSRELVEGSLVRGKYRILSKLGQGGMGVVYLAEHILLGGRVALKFLAGDLGKDPKFIKRFRMEARAAYQLRHPDIVEVTDLDQGEDGSLFIAMEYVEGPSLRAALDEARGGFDIPRALEVARGIASGLAAAHAQGTVHRDIKPENILLASTADGRERPKILDFGIVAMAESVTQVSLTHGLLLTPGYAAPEQWLEMPSAEMDGRTDIYALGCVLYEMLTGRTPFHAHNTAGWMKQHLDESAKPPNLLRPELADWPGLDALVMRLLAKERNDRPQDAEVLSLLASMRCVSVEDRRETVVDEAWKRTETVVEEVKVRPETIVETAPPEPVLPTPPPPMPPEPRPEPAKTQPSERTKDTQSALPERSSDVPAPPRRLRNWFGTSALAAAAQPGAELGKLYVAGWMLLAVCLIGRGVLWLLLRRHSGDFYGLSVDSQDFYFYFLKLAGIATIISGLGIAVSKRTRAIGAMVGAIILALDALCLMFFVADFMGSGRSNLVWWNSIGCFLALGRSGAALMIVGLERLRKGKISRLFAAGRFLFAAAILVFILARIRICVAMFRFGTFDPLGLYSDGFPFAFWWGNWLAYLYIPAAALACVCIFFRRPARRAALFLGAATLLYLPLLCAFHFWELSGGGMRLLSAWLLDMGLAGGALVLAAALGERRVDANVPVSPSVRSVRTGGFFRRRWVRWSALVAGFIVTALITLYGTAPLLFYEASIGDNAAWVDAAGRLYVTVRPADPLNSMIAGAMHQAHLCASGGMDGCLWLGNFYSYAYSFGANSEHAGHFYGKVASSFSARCNDGDGGGCYGLGSLYQAGHGVTKNDASAASLFRRSCDANNALGCRELAYAYRDGKGISRDLIKAEALFTIMCKSGSGYDCGPFFDRLGDAYRQGDGVARNYDKAGALYKKACAFGYSTGCSDLFDVAYDFDTGHGIAVNKVKSAAFYSSACDGGNAAACTNAGVQYDSGDGVALDLAKAAALYQKACNGNDGQGCSNLGMDYWSGSGVEQDKAKGKDLLQKGCTMGNKWGCDQLKEMK